MKVAEEPPHQPQPEKPVATKVEGRPRPPYPDIHNDHHGRQKATINPIVAMTKSVLPARSAVTTYSAAHSLTNLTGNLYAPRLLPGPDTH